VQKAKRRGMKRGIRLKRLPERIFENPEDPPKLAQISNIWGRRETRNQSCGALI
jgi:hypothetical protein